MEKNTLNILIVGPVNSGKSRAMYIIKEALKSHGMEVDFECMPDYDKTTFDGYMSSDLDRCMDAISKRTKVMIRDVQTRRDSSLVASIVMDDELKIFTNNTNFKDKL